MTWYSFPDSPPRLAVGALEVGASMTKRREPAPGEPAPRWVRAPADVRVRWHRPTRFWFVDIAMDGGYRTVPALPAYRDQDKAMTAALRIAAAPRAAREWVTAAAAWPIPVPLGLEQPC